MLGAIGQFFQHPQHKIRLPDAEVARQYPRYRWQVLSATFVGYTVFYVVRNNLSTVAKDVAIALHYDKSMMGDILAITALTYGLGKLFMGAVSDRSDPRKFMSLGLALSAAANFVFGTTTHYGLHLLIWALNGFVQGMGWGPCGRSLGHWFSVRERGTMFAFWNISHNVGGGLAGVIAAYSAARWGWQSAFLVPGLIASAGAVLMFLTLVDTPQSLGLPAIEEYKNDYPEASVSDRELGFKEIFVDYILKNRLLWVTATANFFVYVCRYAMLDWGPTYLREMKDASLTDGGWAVLVIEFGGIPSTLLVGWLSDHLGGRRGMVSLLCMIPVFLAFAGILFNPPGRLWLDMTFLLVVGFFVYPPVMLLGVTALDLSSKKAVGAAAGFVGLFGYLGRTFQAKGLGWLADHYGKESITLGWDAVLYSLLACTVISIVLLAPLWRVRPRA